MSEQSHRDRSPRWSSPSDRGRQRKIIRWNSWIRVLQDKTLGLRKLTETVYKKLVYIVNISPSRNHHRNMKLTIGKTRIIIQDLLWTPTWLSNSTQRENNKSKEACAALRSKSIRHCWQLRTILRKTASISRIGVKSLERPMTLL